MAGRYSTYSDQLDETIEGLISLAGDSPNRDLIYEIIVTAVKLLKDDCGRGELKIINTALKEMRYAFKVFAKYGGSHKVSIFGSARTQPGDGGYRFAKEFARKMADSGWMVITGAGPGIMQAGIEGAGRDHSFGVSIRLPFEETVAKPIEDDPKLINFKYFFTRKLMFAKEANAIVLLPGGFGTMDELFELLTLVQTGKSNIIPFVMLESPGSNYWGRWFEFIEKELAGRGLISAQDLNLIKRTAKVDEAVYEVTHFYRNFHSMRYVRNFALIRLQHAISDDLLAEANDRFGDILKGGQFERSGPMPEEANEPEFAHMPRLKFEFDRYNFGRLRKLIDLVNEHPRDEKMPVDIAGTPQEKPEPPYPPPDEV